MSFVLLHIIYCLLYSIISIDILTLYTACIAKCELFLVVNCLDKKKLLLQHIVEDIKVTFINYIIVVLLQFQLFPRYFKLMIYSLEKS